MSAFLRKRQLKTLLPLPNDKFCKSIRFSVPYDHPHPGSFSGGRKREDPANEVAFRLAKCRLTLS